MRILVAIDGSDPASTAVELVANLALPPGSTVEVLEAVESGVELFGGPWPAIGLVDADRLEDDLREQATRTVAAAAERLVRPGLTVERAVVRGRPASVIVNEALRIAADVIVVGSRGHGTIQDMLLGSVSAEVVDHATVPVLVARGHSIDRVILAWDGSSAASSAAALLPKWPIFGGSTIRVLSVTDVRTPWWTGFPEAGSPEMMTLYVEAADGARQQSDELVREMAARLAADGLTVERERRDGDAAAEIIAAARTWHANLVVVGTHGRTGVARLLLGSVARNVLHHVPSSVLIVHSGTEERRTGRHTERAGGSAPTA
ncbi:MAG TPA: universal stress protein [Candidatus Limnocylindrales bacterium]|nr:universal stress protein [Candidatus Limnocylindrales bacterium]